MCYGGCDCERCTGKDGKMEQKKWVQHISGQGEKWEVSNDLSHTWEVFSKVSCATYDFPKSEYVLCAPSIEWEDVTGECGAFPWNWSSGHPDHNDNGAFYLSHQGRVVTSDGYHLRKVQVWVKDGQHSDMLKQSEQWAFIVERKKP